jgi:hypothetical protein
MPAPRPFGPGLTTRSLRIADPEVVVLRAILEAYDGLALLYGDRTGRVTLATTACQAAQLDALLTDLRHELSFERC